ncbi:hypothetical protein D3C71_1821240 [compost metagenome]|uniref:hypothetical protein n=1 Tax=Rhizobium sp. SJZ105 TaxID=2572678 RepID=UPI000FBC97EA|nr:hypothetical protein [Rhizobium sp. SJZ105]
MPGEHQKGVTHVSIQARFKKIDEDIPEYEVVIDGHAAISKGTGAEGRTKAASAFEYFRQAKAAKEKFLRALEDLEDYASDSGSLTAQATVNADLYLSAIADGETVYEGYCVDELLVRLSPTREPNTGHRSPGF